MDKLIEGKSMLDHRYKVTLQGTDDNLKRLGFGF